MAATVMEGAAEEEKSWRVWRDRTADTNDLKVGLIDDEFKVVNLDLMVSFFEEHLWSYHTVSNFKVNIESLERIQYLY